MGEETLLSDLVLNSRLPKVLLKETHPSCHNVCESQVSQVSFGPSLVSFMSVPLMAVSSSSHIEIKPEGQRENYLWEVMNGRDVFNIPNC